MQWHACKEQGGIQDIIYYYTMLYFKRSYKVKAGRLIENQRGIHHARERRNTVTEKKSDLLLHHPVVQEQNVRIRREGVRNSESERMRERNRRVDKSRVRKQYGLGCGKPLTEEEVQVGTDCVSCKMFDSLVCYE